MFGLAESKVVVKVGGISNSKFLLFLNPPIENSADCVFGCEGFLKLACLRHKLITAQIH
jgi:hypothetical protein